MLESSNEQRTVLISDSLTNKEEVHRMPALNTGTLAPDFMLPTTEGSNFSLADALKRGPVLAVFFKVSCPVCQYTLPYLERLNQAYKNQGATLVGISQNDRKETLAFMREY